MCFQVLETHLLKSNDFDVIQVIQHKLTLNNFTPASKCSVLTKIDASDICTTDSDCTVIHNPNTCGATLLCSTSVTNTPDIFFVGYTHNSSKGYTPNLDKENTNIHVEVNNCTYRLSGIVYLKSHHYWCEVYSTQKHFKKGWFAHNGLWNNGKATFVGLKPFILEKESLYLLMFEQIKTKHPTILSNPCVTFYKSIHPNNQEIIKEIVQQHKCLLSLSDNTAKLANIKAILQYHNIPIKSNMKIADLSDLLLQHCNTTTTVPITFVSDCSIDNYTEASKRDNFSQHELADFVPVTFINDSNMNTLQVQTGEDISETINLKRRNLTPVKQGYTPERHPTKKQKSKPRETKTTSWIDENLHEPMSEPRFIFLNPLRKSNKEMVDALDEESKFSSSESDDDDFEHEQPLHKSELYFIHDFHNGGRRARPGENSMKTRSQRPQSVNLCSINGVLFE